jgi:hypothetical protein
MVNIKDFISELRTKSTKSTYRAGIYAFLDWKYSRLRGERRATPEDMQRYERPAAQYLPGPVTSNPLVMRFSG